MGYGAELITDRRVAGRAPLFRRLGAITAVIALATGAAACGAPAPPDPTVEGWSWTEVGAHPLTRTQGLATDPSVGVGEPGFGETVFSSQFSLERADANGLSLGFTASLPLDLVLSGRYSHTGDIDAVDGTVIVPWENKQLGPSDPPAKAFGLYDSTTLELLGWSRHVLDIGESSDNPWVTVSPDGDLMVSGPYRPLTRLEVFPTVAAPFDDLALLSTIEVVPAPGQPQPSQIQGCDFASDTVLVCASNDEASHKQVVTLELDAPIGSGATTAIAHFHGSAPQAAPLLPLGAPLCASSGEVEGIDVAGVAGRGTVVRILVIDRCIFEVHEYEHVLVDDDE